MGFVIMPIIGRKTVTDEELCKRLQVLHVWPQSTADTWPDVITSLHLDGLYQIGPVAHEAAARIKALKAELKVAREGLKLMIAEYDPIDHMWGNGCTHGFKPARDCPNKDCTDATLHRALDRFQDYQAIANMESDDG